jgi:hypothetical protein
MSHLHPTTAVPTRPFERHGIRHLSPSSLSLYRNSPGQVFTTGDGGDSWSGQRLPSPLVQWADAHQPESARVGAGGGSVIATTIDTNRRAAP